MKYIQVENGLIIKSWCDAPEDGAIEQAKNLANMGKGRTKGVPNKSTQLVREAIANLLLVLLMRTSLLLVSIVIMMDIWRTMVNFC